MVWEVSLGTLIDDPMWFLRFARHWIQGFRSMPTHKTNILLATVGQKTQYIYPRVILGSPWLLLFLELSDALN